MSKDEPDLAPLAEYTDVTIRGETFEQFGAVCLRTGSQGRIEILLVTTRETRRWTIPKGWPIKGLKPHEVAEREAWEEAGVKGKAKKRPLGSYAYLKTLDDGSMVATVVEAHLLTVEKVSDKFPEYRERTIEWVSPIEAATRVDEPELKKLLAALATRPAA
jgi:8-oxo-dGTP pyrophosphatase MutT (NUDIX family)